MDSRFKTKKVTLRNLVIEYHAKLLDLFQNTEERSSKVNPVSTSRTNDEPLRTPISLYDCVVGLSPLHLPSHGLILISKGNADIQIQPSNNIFINININTGSLYLIDDKRSQKSMGTNLTDGRRQNNKHEKNSSQVNLDIYFLTQGYCSVATISGALAELSISNTSKMGSQVSLGVKIEDIYLRTCADSTHSLLQLINDLKPPFELPPLGERYKFCPESEVDTFHNVDDGIFTLKHSAADEKNFDLNADFIYDDVPANLEFVESYYADHATRSQWTTSSSGSLTTSYSNTDILLEEDLTELVSRTNNNKTSVVDFNDKSSKKLGSFEQRAQSHDSILNITEDHFGKREGNTNKLMNNSPLINTKKEIYTPQYVPPGENDTTNSINFPNDSFPLLSSHNLFSKDNKLSYCNNTSPVIISFEVVTLTWDLHDGFDWKYTRDIITNAVFQVEEEVHEVWKEKQNLNIEDIHKTAPNKSNTQGESYIRDYIENSGSSIKQMADESDPDSRNLGNEESVSELEVDDVIGGVLFNSIYIGMSTHQDSSELRKRINKELNDYDFSDTTSQTSVPQSVKSTQTGFYASNNLRKNVRGLTPLKLKRSKSHKIRISLENIEGTVQLFSGITDFPLDYEIHKSDDNDKAMILNKINLKVGDLEILDNVQTSTWNKFLTYMRNAGERETGASMIKLTMENIKPIPHLPTSEVILNVNVLPLRLHVDQDTLDFLTRFFEFKDDRFDGLLDHLQVELPFIQKIDIRDIPVKLDYKPKKVDYAGLRSGRTTEFMNFFILDEAEMTLRHITLHGITGFPRMAQKLNDIWMPDIKRNQLGDVLSGLAPVRSLVKIGSGICDLVTVPVREYRKDGRVVRSIQKGAWEFARNTSNEIVKFGAKLAAGTQTMLENAEQAMGGTGSAGRLKTTRGNPPTHSNIPFYGTANVNKDDSFNYNYGNDSDADGDENPRDYYQHQSDDNVDNLVDNKRTLNNDTRTTGVRFETHSTLSSKSLASASKPDISRPSAVVSLYADQPRGVKQGLQSAIDSLGRNLSIAKDAVVDIKTEAVRTGSAQVSFFSFFFFNNSFLTYCS